MRHCGDFAVVATVYSQIDLAIHLSLLEQEGIWAVARGAGHASVEWNLTVALGGIDLLVHREDAGDAAELFCGLERRFPSRGIYSDVRILDIALTLLLFFFGAPPPARIPAFHHAVAASRVAED